MRVGFLIAAGVLLIGGVVYVATRVGDPPGTAPSAVGRADANPEPSGLSTELHDTEPRVPAETGKSVDAPPAEAAPEPEMRPEDDLLPADQLVVNAGASGAEAGVTAGSEFFERKYAGRDAKVRRQAFDRLRSIHDAHAAGTEDKERALTEAQLLSILAELDWLKSNPGS